MEIIKEGKEEVLNYLESKSKNSTGQIGKYILCRDDNGLLFLTIAGFSFIGQGNFKLDDNIFTVINGLVINVKKMK